jgi:CubicO group peptidase (beta-lactamase class C family)
MTRNHLPGGGTLVSLGRGQFAETAYDGVGFGLGFGVNVDPVRSRVSTSEGEFTWGGLASTAFWVDRTEQLTAHFYTQLCPPAPTRSGPSCGSWSTARSSATGRVEPSGVEEGGMRRRTALLPLLVTAAVLAPAAPALAHPTSPLDPTLPTT